MFTGYIYRHAHTRTHARTHAKTLHFWQKLAETNSATCNCLYTQVVLDAFAKFRRATVAFVMFVCLSVLSSVRMEHPGSNWQIIMKFDIWVFRKVPKNSSYLKTWQ